MSDPEIYEPCIWEGIESKPCGWVRHFSTYSILIHEFEGSYWYEVVRDNERLFVSQGEQAYFTNFENAIQSSEKWCKDHILTGE